MCQRVTHSKTACNRRIASKLDGLMSNQQIAFTPTIALQRISLGAEWVARPELSLPPD